MGPARRRTAVVFTLLVTAMTGMPSAAAADPAGGGVTPEQARAAVQRANRALGLPAALGLPGTPGLQGALGRPAVPGAPGRPAVPGAPGLPGALGRPAAPGRPGSTAADDLELAFTGPAAGARHTCTTTLVAGGAWCWGANDSGQLGTGTTTGSSTPKAVGGELAKLGVYALAAGDAHTCAMAGADDDMVLYCWGAGDHGQLGDGGTTARTRPVRVATGVAAVAAGAEHTCAVDGDDETLSCWGRNTVGQLGSDTGGADAPLPRPVAGLDDVVSVAAGENDTCAVDDDGDAWCWGSDTHGQLGDGGGASGTPATAPRQVVAVPDGFGPIAVGRRHACALTGAGDAYCWGDDAHGQLGAGTTPADPSEPVRVAGGHTFVSISAGGDSTCATDDDGAAWCWGAGADGRLGDGATADRNRPSEVDGSRITLPAYLQDIVGVTTSPILGAAVGARHACFTDLTFAPYCAGAGTDGQLGTGSNAAVSVPARVLLGPLPARDVAVTARDAGLTVRWAPPASTGAAPVEAYAAVAISDSDETGGESCETTGARTCTIADLDNGTRYAVFVAVLTRGGVSYSGFTAATPKAPARPGSGGGGGGGLPVTGPGDTLTAATVLLLTGVGLLLAGSLRWRRGIPS